MLEDQLRLCEFCCVTCLLRIAYRRFLLTDSREGCILEKVVKSATHTLVQLSGDWGQHPELDRNT